AMPRDYDRIVGQRQQLIVNRAQNLAPIAAGEIGAADTLPKQRVARHQLAFRRYPQADATLRVAGRVEHVDFGCADQQPFALGGLAGPFVAEDRAVALEHPHRQDLVNHMAIVYSPARGVGADCILTNMADALFVLMRWLHFTSMATLVGGILYGRLVMTRAAG